MDRDTRPVPPADDGRWPSRFSGWFQPTSVELLGLVVLLTGALAVTGVAWWSAASRPAVLPDAAHSPVESPGRHAVATAPHGPDGRDADAGPVHEAHRDEPGDGATALTVHVTGAVVHPGLVSLPPGARVGDAVVLAGGLAADALSGRVNLARTLADGEQVYVPRVGDDLPPPGDGVGASLAADAAEPSPEHPLDLNRATPEQLEALPGIGPARAQAIFDYREEHGAFEVPGDLRAVSGIGEQTFQGLAELVTVS